MRAAVFFATREGQTRRIALRIATDLRAKGADVDLFDVRNEVPIDWLSYGTACVAASVHAGHHEGEMIDFVRKHRAELERLSAAFISVTLSEAGAEDTARTDADRARAAVDVQHMLDVFVTETGWKPERCLPVAGALAYSRYNIFVRFIMKRIARKAGAPTDASRDYEFTNWPALDRFVEGLTAKRH
jgi:menaquinone-dependent protoporphyrinogen oxidase